MAVEKLFVKEGIKQSNLEEFLRTKFDRAGYSHLEIERTPLGTRIIVFAHKPGLVIGASGRRVNELTEEIKAKFEMENPLVDVKEVPNPFLDANIMAHRIAKALERGINFKKVCNYYISEIMKSGAIGVSIRAAGKLAGSERSRFQKFRSGFIAHSGGYARQLVDKGYARAMLKPGIVGLQVKIMRESPNEVMWKKAEPVEEPTKEAESTEKA